MGQAKEGAVSVSKDENRWFPGERSLPRLEHGWRLAAGERWVSEAFDAVDLEEMHLRPSRILELGLRVDDDSKRIGFADVADVHVDGSFHVGTTSFGWEVMGTSMLVGESERADGRWVYVVELPVAILTFASLPGTWVGT